MNTHGNTWAEALFITGAVHNGVAWITTSGFPLYSVQAVFDAAKFGVPKTHKTVPQPKAAKVYKPQGMTIADAAEYLGPIEYRGGLFKVSGLRTELKRSEVIVLAEKVKAESEARNGNSAHSAR